MIWNRRNDALVGLWIALHPEILSVAGKQKFGRTVPDSTSKGMDADRLDVRIRSSPLLDVANEYLEIQVFVRLVALVACSLSAYFRGESCGIGRYAQLTSPIEISNERCIPQLRDACATGGKQQTQKRREDYDF